LINATAILSSDVGVQLKLTRIPVWIFIGFLPYLSSNCI